MQRACQLRGVGVLHETPFRGCDTWATHECGWGEGGALLGGLLGKAFVMALGQT